MTPVTSFVRGLRHALAGLRYVYRDNLSLSRFYVWPIAIMGVAIYLAFGVVLSGYEAWAAAMWAPPEGAALILYRAFEIVVLLLGLGAALVAAALASSIVAAPFNDALSEAVEEIETGQEAPAFALSRVLADVVRTVRVEAGKVAIYVAVMGPLFVLSFLVPGVGQVVYTAFGVLFTASFLAIDYVDWPASRRGLGFRARLALFREHAPAMLGFGAGVWVLLFIPLVNLFFMPAAVAGGTRLFLEIELNRSAGARVGAGEARPGLPPSAD